MKKASLWKYPDSEPKLEKEFSYELKIPEPVVRVLLNRGIESLEEARKFLHPSLENLHSPFLLKGVYEAVSRIAQAISKGEKITIYGDYDVDGVASAVLLVQALRSLGGHAEYFLPSRFQEGYGLQKEPLLSFREAGTTLLITTDCGTNSKEEVAYARNMGMDIIVTDHHHPQLILDEAVAVINPHQKDCDYPWPSLSGTGVAYKLVCALLETAGEQYLDSGAYLDLVALGTVADLVPLLDENRILTKCGLNLINERPRPGIRALLQASGTEKKVISSQDLAFVLAPSLNAAGRLGKADPAADLLMSDSFEHADKTAQFLYQENLNRRRTEQKILEEARLMIEEKPEEAGDRVLVLCSENWHQGVIGIVASRLLELYYRPVVLIALDGNVGKGSARSIAGFNITDALNECADLLHRYGGHAQAAGLTIPLEKVDELRKRLNLVGRKWIREDDLRPCLRLEGKLNEEEINHDLAFHLEKLAPYGIGNPYPRFYSKGWRLENWRRVGKDKSHVKFTMSRAHRQIFPILFSGEDYLKQLTPERSFDLVLAVSNGTWKERSVLNLEIKDMRMVDGKVVEGLEVVDKRSHLDRVTYLQKALEVVDLPLVYAGTMARKEYLQEKLSLSQNQESCILSNNLDAKLIREMIKKNRKESHSEDFVIDLFYFHLPLRATIVEKIIQNCGNPSTLRVHLLYNSADRKINKKVVKAAFPSLSCIHRLFQQINKISDYSGTIHTMQINSLLEQESKHLGEAKLRRTFTMLEEMGLIKPISEGQQYCITSQNPKMDELAATDAYQENCSFMEDCVAFQDFMLEASPDEILTYLKGLRTELSMQR